MRPNNRILRLATPVVAIAGTICLTLPAYAGGGGEALRQMRLDNPGMSNRQIRQFVRNDSVSVNRHGQPNSGAMSEFRHQVRVEQRALPLNDLGARLNRFNGQSAFLTDNGRARAVSNGLELDLTSSERSIVLGDGLFSSGETRTINVGGEERTLTSGSKVSAAEYVALQQILNGGSQGLAVDQNGRGVGGQFSLNNISDGGKTIRAAQLVIPEGVTASGDFSRNADGVRVTNDLINYGSINAYSSNRNTDTAKIAARDISNNAGASISTSAERLNLSLRADRDINNDGSISSSGNLDLFAGRSINNHGSINSQANITFLGNIDSNLSVDNTGGTISALNGAINVRSADYTGTGNTTVFGGDLYSRELNLFTGLGTADVNVNDITGVLNSSGTAAHVNSNTDTLTIGSQCLVGDPTYYNTGNIILDGNITVGEDVAIIAGGDITASAMSDLFIRAQDAVTGAGYNITIVAGANVVAGFGEVSPAGGPATLPSQTLPPSQNTTLDVSFSTNSLTGGSIDFSSVTDKFGLDSSGTKSNFSGGNITLAAFADGSGNKGVITLPTNIPDTSIKANGFGTGNNGNVQVLAGGTNTTSITLPAITNSGGSGSAVGTGNVTIVTAQPTTSDSNPITFNILGQVISSNSLVPSANNAANASISMFGVSAGPSTLTVNASSAIDLKGAITASGAIAGTKGGIVTLRANDIKAVGISADGAIDKSGGLIEIFGNSASALQLFGDYTVQGGTAGGDGGIINVNNGGTGGITSFGANYNARSSVGSGGTILFSTPGSFKTFSGSIINARGGTFDGAIQLTASDVDVMSGGTFFQSFGHVGGSILINTTVGGVKVDKNEVSFRASGELTLDLANNTINAGNLGDRGGSITVEGFIDLPDGVLNLNASSATGEGIVHYVDLDTTPTFINGVPNKPPRDFNLINASVSSLNGGDRGQVSIIVGGALTVNPAGLADVAQTIPGGLGIVTLKSGTASPKGAPLVITQSLDLSGFSGAPGGIINIEESSLKPFVIQPGKLSRNGVAGQLIGEQVFVTNNFDDIKIGSSNAIAGSFVALTAGGLGKITASKGVVLSANFALNLTTAESDINITVNTPQLQFSGGEDVVITNQFAGPSFLVSSTAKEDVKYNTVAGLSVNDVSITTKGDLEIITGASSGGALTLTGNISVIDGSIKLVNNDILNGVINVFDGITIATSGDRGGDVNIAIGPVPKKPINPVSGTVGAFTITNTGKGQTFFGANPSGITGASNIALNAINKKIVINNGSLNFATKQIIFGNDITVTADPPGRR